MTIDVTIEKNPLQVTNCPQNFTVTEYPYDKGCVTGVGVTEALAKHDFKVNYELKHDEVVELNIIER